MKVFIADNQNEGKISKNDYHWCNNGEMLMFGQFQIGNGNPSEVSMCGIQSRKYTTHILVKDLDISKDFYKEILSQSVEKAMNCVINSDGSYEVEMGFTHKFNINDIVDELITKASQFEDGQKVRCMGITLYEIN
jgi:diaminopimelate epimerase